MGQPNHLKSIKILLIAVIVILLFSLGMHGYFYFCERNDRSAEASATIEPTETTIANTTTTAATTMITTIMTTTTTASATTIITITTDEFTPYTIEVKSPELLIYENPGTSYSITGTITDFGTYTIVDEIIYAENPDEKWGKLKSGLGWINLYDAVSAIPYTIAVKHPALPIYENPGTSYAITGTITDFGTYTIVDEISLSSQPTDQWGKLKSGLGWINLYDAQNSNPYEDGLAEDGRGESLTANPTCVF